MNGEVHMILQGVIVALIVRLELKALQEIIWRNKNVKQMLDVKLKKGLIWVTSCIMIL